jgi:tRNA threonylcarbamoyladenosine biosynthesis protein TsaE
MTVKSLRFKVDNIEETKKLAGVFAKTLEPGLLICLYGPIGTGKTTFVKFIGEVLGIEEEITSPSFVIINEYYSGKFPLYHFDLYRLEKEGIKSIISELEEYSSDHGAVTFVEWAEFSGGNLLEERLDIEFVYDEEFSDNRTIILKAAGNKAEMLLERVNAAYVNS